MLIRLPDQSKLDELVEYVGTLPIEVNHVMQGDNFPMVADVELGNEASADNLFVSPNDITWVSYAEWFAGVKDYLREHFEVIL